MNRVAIRDYEFILCGFEATPKICHCNLLNLCKTNIYEGTFPRIPPQGSIIYGGVLFVWDMESLYNVARVRKVIAADYRVLIPYGPNGKKSRMVPYGPVLIPYSPVWSRMLPYGPVLVRMVPYTCLHGPYGIIRDHNGTILDQGSYGTIWDQYGTIRDHTGPYGTIWDHGTIYGTIWDHTGSVRDHTGPYTGPYWTIQDHTGSIRDHDHMGPYGSAAIIFQTQGRVCGG